MTLTFGAATHQGSLDYNGDAIFARMLSQNAGVFAVVDGIGGEIAVKASEITVQAIEQNLDTLIVSDNTATALDNVLQTANSRIIEYGTNNEKSWGLGASITLAIAKQDSIAIAQVGNSQGYAVTPDNLTRITDIHDVIHALIKAGHLASIEEARDYNIHNILYRALGMQDKIEVDLTLHQLPPNSGLLLCTPYLSHYLSKDEILNIMVSNKSAQNVCDALIEACLNTNRRHIFNVSAVFISNQFEFQAKDD